jgi:2'-5' RNA ligase
MTAAGTASRRVAERPHRLFVAVPLPPEPIAEVTALVEGVRAGPLGRVPRWVHLPNLHLTVRFLGETPPELVDDVAVAVRSALEGTEAFHVVLAGAGSFPPAGKIRALWLGLEEGTASLERMARALDPALEPLGWAPDSRPYRPHLTIARLDSSSRADGAAVASHLREAARGWRTTFRADRIVLYASYLGGGPPRHDPILELPLPG